MPTIRRDTTLADVVDANPSLARTLDRRGLDYCCGGGRTIAEACEEAGLDADEVIGELEGAATEESPAPWASMGLVELVDHLETTHHRYLKDELPRISRLAEKVESVHGERHPELHDVRRCYEEIRADLEPHLMKEERVLFPMVRELATATTLPEFHCGSLANPISVMLREHDRVGELLRRLRDLTHGFVVPPDGCASYDALYRGLEDLERDTHLHVYKENSYLFPEVERTEAAMRR